MEKRFVKYVMPEPNSGCWLWTGSVGRFGHGQFAVSNRPIGAHRISWLLGRGPIPDGLCVLHKCDVPSCVNPDHLFLGTKGDNARDMFAKGRARRDGEHHPQAKLTQCDVEEIRMCNATCRQIASAYGITHQNVSDIKTNKRWKEEVAISNNTTREGKTP